MKIPSTNRQFSQSFSMSTAEKSLSRRDTQANVQKTSHYVVGDDITWVSTSLPIQHSMEKSNAGISTLRPSQRRQKNVSQNANYYETENTTQPTSRTVAKYEQAYRPNSQQTNWIQTNMEETTNKVLIGKTINNYEEIKNRQTEIELHALDELQVTTERSKYYDPRSHLYQETHHMFLGNLDGTNRQLPEYNQTITTRRNDQGQLMRKNNWQITAYSKPEMVNIPIVSRPSSRRKRNLYSESDSNSHKQNTTNQLSRGDIVGDNRHSGKAEIAEGQHGEQTLVLQKTPEETSKWQYVSDTQQPTVYFKQPRSSSINYENKNMPGPLYYANKIMPNAFSQSPDQRHETYMPSKSLSTNSLSTDSFENLPRNKSTYNPALNQSFSSIASSTISLLQLPDNWLNNSEAVTVRLKQSDEEFKKVANSFLQTMTQFSSSIVQVII